MTPPDSLSVPDDDEFDDGMTLAGAEVNVPKPPPSTPTTPADIPDEFDDGRTLAGADVPAPPPGGASAPASSGGGGAAANFFIRLRRTDEAGEGQTWNGVEIITIGSSDDAVMTIDHELIAETHAQIDFADGVFTLLVRDGEVSVNGEALSAPAKLCRDDTINLGGTGGPTFNVDMMYPNRDRQGGGGGEVSGPLAMLKPLAAPIAGALNVDPVFGIAILLFGIFGSCTVLSLLFGMLGSVRMLFS